MNDVLTAQWTNLSKELTEVAFFTHGTPITSSEGYTEEVIRLSFEPTSNNWLCTCEIAIGLDCYEKGNTPEEALQKGFALLVEKLACEKEKIQAGKYYLYGLEEA